MTTTTRVLARLLYAVNGVAFLAGGAATLLVNTGVLPDAVREVVMDFSNGDLGFLHIVQELGSLLVLAGLLALWFVVHYNQSCGFHWAMTVYWGIMALIHWFHVAGPPESIVAPLINTIPVTLFLTLGVLRMTTEHDRPG